MQTDDHLWALLLFFKCLIKHFPIGQDPQHNPGLMRPVHFPLATVCIPPSQAEESAALVSKLCALYLLSIQCQIFTDIGTSFFGLLVCAFMLLGQKPFMLALQHSFWGLKFATLCSRSQAFLFFCTYSFALVVLCSQFPLAHLVSFALLVSFCNPGFLSRS